MVLTGTSASKELKSGICGVVQGVDGVTDCTNNLYQVSVGPRDRELRQQIYDSIYSKYLPSYSPYRPGERPTGGNVYQGPHAIRIIEDKQHVSLYGHVYSAEDKGSATHAAQVVPGVAAVENYLQVVPRPDGS